MVALAMVWAPEFRAHWAWPFLVSESLVEHARTVPDRSVLERISRQSLGVSSVDTPAGTDRGGAIVRAADSLLAGESRIPRLPVVQLKVPFDESNLVAGPPTHRLYVAGLGTADLLLRAYRVTGALRYLTAAENEIEAFARVERRRLLPVGLLWNDHALAATVSVLANYWSLVRDRPNLDIDHAREVLSLVQRTVARLVRPQNYTFRTNHGLMQNLALLQAAAAFPYFDQEGRLRSTACRRIAEQSEYYLSPEGPILEHSAGYHIFGLELFGILEEFIGSRRCALPADFASKLARARAVGAILRRPDGSIPTYGNTDRATRVSSQLVGSSVPESPEGLYPTSGLAVKWQGLASWPDSARLAQSVVTWSNFPSRAHKLADDLSLVVWAGGDEWLLNSGYWPYGGAGEESARGWRGSNAPHFTDEPAVGVRRTTLLAHGGTERVWILDLSRTATGGTEAVRRQVVAIDGRLWVVVDSTGKTAGRSLSTLWTSDPDTQVHRISDTDFRMRSKTTGREARLAILGRLQAQARLAKGSLEPFAGWTVNAGIPTPSPSIEAVSSDSKPLVITVLAVDRDQVGGLAAASGPALAPNAAADGWSIALAGDFGARSVRREGSELTVEFTDGSSSRVALAAAHMGVDERRSAIVAAYEAAASRRARFPDLLFYRYRVTWILLGLLLAQEVFFLSIRRMAPSPSAALRALAAIAWVMLGVWAAYSYLQLPG